MGEKHYKNEFVNYLFFVLFLNILGWCLWDKVQVIYYGNGNIDVFITNLTAKAKLLAPYFWMPGCQVRHGAIEFGFH
jgi:hypothetical protein